MSDRPPKGVQLQAINPWMPLVQTSFSLTADDAFVTGQGIDYAHFKATPSPIGLKDRGDYRRDGLDAITSNGMIYVCAGTFSAAEVSNTRDKRRTDGGTDDPSVSNLIMPRFYNKSGPSMPGQINIAPEDDGCRIYMAPGDRIYVNDPKANVLVSNYQKMTYEHGDNVPMFPIVNVELPIYDSKNIQYIQGLDYIITTQGNISWLSTGKNPGFDPETGLGGVYSIRYLYKAFFYVVQLPKEVRMAVITKNGVRTPERMAYNAVIQREYLYHSQNRPDPLNQSASKTPERAVQQPLQTVKPNPNSISVDMVNIAEDNDNFDYGSPPLIPPNANSSFLLENGNRIEIEDDSGVLILE